ncbi:hypothetical protein BOTBODRAFT_189196 [Botryobasidium botryosum FD-172 SS1]|uniref:Transmembrane protein n=1 Tax=Botryobasidium botryosum (strain FD-172 SS1) TaxID=930990 RepID=A0A067MLM2_BOTB1|nr:hypothetical protein BOTBODRAFT_189196 [Botryobasidium botryosum FD-172 SS1]
MRFGAILSAVLSFGLLVVAAPTSNVQDVAVARSLPIDLAIRDVSAPVARYVEERDAFASIQTREDFITTVKNAQAVIVKLCADITIQINAKVDVAVVLKFFADLTVQLDIILKACASIGLLIDINLVVKLILDIFVTICVVLKLCLTVYVDVAVIVSGVAAIVVYLTNILLAIAVKNVLFAVLFIAACTVDNLALFLSVGLDVKVILKAFLGISL